MLLLRVNGLIGMKFLILTASEIHPLVIWNRQQWYVSVQDSILRQMVLRSPSLVRHFLEEKGRLEIKQNGEKKHVQVFVVKEMALNPPIHRTFLAPFSPRFTYCKTISKMTMNSGVITPISEQSHAYYNAYYL